MDEIGSWNIYVLIPTFTAPITSEKLKAHFNFYGVTGALNVEINT